ncbi:MAG: dihydropteroate synthase, partial [Gammaproteobacteria bacterium]
EVMRAAVAAGAGLINDVRALREPGALSAAVELDIPVCLMHMQGEPRAMQNDPHYGDVVSEVRAFLLERVGYCESAGMDRDQMLIDPGFGFGKTLEHNLQLLRGLGEFVDTGLPVLVGMSRKSMIGALTDRPVDQRVSGSVAAATVAVRKGASVSRVHEVAATADAVRVAEAIKGQERS